MSTHEFSLLLSGIDEADEELAGWLYAAGCDDGTLSSSAGTARVRFSRKADSLEAAILSAVRDVRAAGCQVARVETDESLTVNRLNQQLTASGA